jgi:hypothetical protein
MPETPERRVTHVIREPAGEDSAETAAAVRTVDPDAALEDYAELARLLRAADQAGDRAAVVQIRELMDGIWPALTEEQRGRIEDGEFDW